MSITFYFLKYLAYRCITRSERVNDINVDTEKASVATFVVPQQNSFTDVDKLNAAYEGRCTRRVWGVWKITREKHIPFKKIRPVSEMYPRTLISKDKISNMIIALQEEKMQSSETKKIIEMLKKIDAYGSFLSKTDGKRGNILNLSASERVKTI